MGKRTAIAMPKNIFERGVSFLRVRVRIDSEGYFYGRHKAHRQADRKNI